MNNTDDKSISNILWLARGSIAILIFFIFINKQEVIDHYNESAWWGLITSALIAWLVAEWTIRSISTSTRMLVILVIVGAVALYADSFGTMAHLYSNYAWYDLVMHYVGTFSLTLWLWFVILNIFNKNNASLAPSWHMWLVLTTAVFMGNLFEFVEYVADILFVRGSYWITSETDTVEDIIMNTLGSGTAIAIMGWRERVMKSKH